MVDGKEESINSVQFLKTNSGKKGEGMPVVRNPQFYFREGLCWSDINTTFLKCRKKEKSIHDVKSMSIFGVSDLVEEDTLEERYTAEGYNSFSEFITVQEAIAMVQVESQGKGAK